MHTATSDATVVIILSRAINVSEMTKSLLRHDTKQSREVALEEMSLQTTVECGQKRYDNNKCNLPSKTTEILNVLKTLPCVFGSDTEDADAHE